MVGIDKWQEKETTRITALRKNPQKVFGEFFQSLETKRNRIKKENIEELAAQEILYTDWLVQVGRWGVIIFLALYGIKRFSSSVFIDLAGYTSPVWKYFFLLILWGIINAFYQKTGGPKSRNTALCRIGIDICFLLLFVHYTGGAQSFCFALFILISVEAALQLRGILLPLLAVAVSTVLFGLLLAGEFADVLIHLPILNYEVYSPIFNLFLFLFSGLLNFACVAVVTHLTGENRKYSEILQAQVGRDLLTGTYTREVFFKQLESEIERCSRSNQALSIIMLGIDGMEEYNRQFGYPEGDRLLAKVGEIILKNIRKSFRSEVGSKDTACRYSGDIFAIILPEAKPAYNPEEMRKLKEQMHSRGVIQVAQRLQSRIAEISSASGPVQISVGGGHWPYHGDSTDKLVGEAFRALMEAKSKGKNRVVVAIKGV
jgi:diguanylate cyclase (GGDEF)-like protein